MNEISETIKRRCYLASVEEWTVTFKTSENYSWTKREQIPELKFLNYYGSISLILLILSYGMYFSSIVQHLVNSEMFLKYLNYLEKWYSSEQSWKDKRLVCMMDNCSSHSSGQILSKIKFSVICYIFILIYSPQLAAVESAFNTFKWRLNRATRNKRIKLSTVDGFNSLS